MWITDLNRYQANETAASYITNTLAKYAIKVPDGYTAGDIGKMLIDGTYDQLDISNLSQGYTYSMKGNKHSFKAIDFSQTKSNINISYGTQNSNVISFAVSNVGIMVMTDSNRDKETGKPYLDSSALDYFSGDYSYASIGKQSTTETSEYQNWFDVKQDLSNIVVKSTASTDSLIANVSSTWRRIRKLDYFCRINSMAEKEVKLLIQEII